MGSIRTRVTLILLTLTLSLATSAAAQGVSGPEFIGIEPCRLADTRPGSGFAGAYGPPALVEGSPRNFTIQGQCGIPATATAVAFNFTITQATGTGHLTVWPAGGPFPATSILNYVANEDVANGNDVRLGAGGAISVQSFAMTHLVIDVYGYFTDVEELGNGNTALGDRGLLSNTTGVNNTALGAGALTGNTTGNSNTATGFQALLSNTTGSDNTATGLGALGSNTTGDSNTAAGFHALLNNTTGDSNTALGASALFSNTTGLTNTALGVGALFSNTAGEDNTALGVLALFSNTTGVNNTALGDSALINNTTGNTNIAIGIGAGANVTAGSSNIHIGNVGVQSDTATIRIGNQGVQTSTFIAGISGQTSASGVAVLVNAAGQLGATTSSRRAKDEIRDMGVASEGVLKLRPVTFRYKPQHDDDARLAQYGLIAEEVAEIYPELVVHGTDGQPAGVRYHVLPAMLLNELQRQQRVIETQAAQAREQARLIDELTARLSRLEAMGIAAAGR